MQIGVGSLMKLAQMICGDEPFNFFPYRSSSYLTRFFVDLACVHDGSTRCRWVNDALKEINNQPSQMPSMPAPGMVKVAENLLDPENFLSNQNMDHAKAIDVAKKLLATYNLTLSQKSNGQITFCPAHGKFVSMSHETPLTEKLITFKPNMLSISNKLQNDRLVSIMMHFNATFAATYDAVKRVADHMGLECLWAGDIWDNLTFMQNVFDLSFRAKVIVVDFISRNPDVMCETGIAHTLGKTLIPIIQSLDDIPSDLGYHRVLKYLLNEEDYRNLSNELWQQLKTINGTTN